jgi:hypothetical protein
VAGERKANHWPAISMIRKSGNGFSGQTMRQ